MAGVKQETAAVLFLLNSQMLFEGKLGIVSERSGTVVPFEYFKKCRLVGGGGRAPQGVRFKLRSYECKPKIK